MRHLRSSSVIPVLIACSVAWGVGLTGCSESLTPTLAPHSTPQPLARLSREGKLPLESLWAEGSAQVEFSVSAEQLAALVIQAAKAEGWHARATATRHPGGSYVVYVVNPFEEHLFGYVEYDIMVFGTSGKSAVLVDEDAAHEDDSALPRRLLGPVREHVQAYLAGRPLTPDEKRRLDEAVAAPSPRLPEERLKDIKRLRDKGYLSQQEYDAKRAAILEEL